MTALRFDGWIAGIGTTGGTRLVLGHWPRSPFGPVSDVMVERPDGHRVLLAGTAQLAGFVAGTYRFDEVQVVPVDVVVDGTTWAATAAFSLRRRMMSKRRKRLSAASVMLCATESLRIRLCSLRSSVT